MKSLHWPATLATASLSMMFLLWAGPASAGWTAQIALGGAQVFSDPSCAAATVVPGTLVCMAVGSVGRPIADRYDGTRWTGWVGLPGTIASAPSCFEMKGLDVWCGARSTSGRLVTYTYDGTWAGPLVAGGALADAPSCVSLNLVRALCAARAEGGGIFTAEFTAKSIAEDGSWKVLPTFGNTLIQPVSPVRCAVDGQPLADAYCIWENGTSALVRRFVSELSAWDPSIATVPAGTPLESLGCAHFSTYGLNSSGGAAVDRGDDMLCYGIGRDHFLYVTANYAGTGGVDAYQKWNPIPNELHLGKFACAPAVAPKGWQFQNVCLVTGTDSGAAIGFELYGNDALSVFVPGPTIGGASLPHAQFEGTPSCVAYRPANADDTVMCVFRDAKNVAYSTTGP